MKSILLTLLFSIFLFTTLYSQDKMPVQEVIRETSKGLQPGFMISIENGNLKTTQKDWEKKIKNAKISDVLKKSEEKVQFSHQGDEYLANNANIPAISSTPLNVITTIADTKEGIRIIAFYELDDSFISKINSKEETYLAAKNYLRSFGIESLTQVVKKELNAQEEILKGFENDLDKLRSKKNDYEKGIGKNQSNIREMQSSIKTNLIDQERQMEKVNFAKDTLYTFERKTETYKLFKGKLKDQEKQFKKLVKDNKAYHAKIKKFELNIAQYKDKISANKKEQQAQKELIDEQRKVVKAIDKKLYSIK